MRYGPFIIIIALPVALLYVLMLVLALAPIAALGLIGGPMPPGVPEWVSAAIPVGMMIVCWPLLAVLHGFCEKIGMEI